MGGFIKSCSILRLSGFLLVLFTLACSQSPAPKVEELVKVRVPTLGGSIERYYTTPSQTYNLTGECDTTSRKLEYSLNNSTWIEFASDCSAGTFALPTLTLSDGMTNIYVRAYGKFTATDAAVAHVRFELPPSSPLQTFVSSSRADSSDGLGYGTQNALSDFIPGEPAASGNIRLHTLVPGVVYTEQ